MLTRMFETTVSVIQDSAKKISPYIPAPIKEFAQTYWFFANPNTVTSVRYEVANLLEPFNLKIMGSKLHVPLLHASLSDEEQQRVLIRSPAVRETLKQSAKTNLLFYVGVTWLMQVALKETVNFVIPRTRHSTFFNLSIPFLLLRYLAPSTFIDNTLYGTILKTRLTANKIPAAYFVESCHHDEEKRGSASVMSSIYYLADSTLLLLASMLLTFIEWIELVDPDHPIIKILHLSLFFLVCLREGQVFIEGNFALANVCSEDLHIQVAKNPIPIVSIGTWLFVTQYMASSALCMLGLRSSFSDAAISWFLYHYGLMVGYELTKLLNSGPQIDFFKKPRIKTREILTVTINGIKKRLENSHLDESLLKLAFYVHAYPTASNAPLVIYFNDLAKRYPESKLTNYESEISKHANVRQYLLETFPQIRTFNLGKNIGMSWYLYSNAVTQTLLHVFLRNDYLELDNVLAKKSVYGLLALKSNNIESALQTVLDYANMKFSFVIRGVTLIEIDLKNPRVLQALNNVINFFIPYVPDVVASEDKKKIISLLANKILLSKDIDFIIECLERAKIKLVNARKGQVGPDQVKTIIYDQPTILSGDHVVSEDENKIRRSPMIDRIADEFALMPMPQTTSRKPTPAPLVLANAAKKKPQQDLLADFEKEADVLQPPRLTIPTKPSIIHSSLNTAPKATIFSGSTVFDDYELIPRTASQPLQRQLPLKKQ